MKLTKVSKVKATTYDAGDGFFVDIANEVAGTGEEIFYAYLYRENDIRVPMYGFDKSHITLRGFIKRLEYDIDEYKEIYDDRLEYLSDWDYDYDEEDDDDCPCCPECGEPMMFGTEQEVEQAKVVQDKFFAYVRENFKTKYTDSVNAFIDWMKRSHPIADWWIACDKNVDAFYDMFTVLEMFENWRRA